MYHIFNFLAIVANQKNIPKVIYRPFICYKLKTLLKYENFSVYLTIVWLKSLHNTKEYLMQK